MKSLADICEGFFSNVGVDIGAIQEWMKKLEESGNELGHYGYYDYDYFNNYDNCTIRIHNKKRSTDKSDIIIDVTSIWNDIKNLDPSAPPLVVWNKYTLSQKSIPSFEKRNGKGNSVIRFRGINIFVNFLYDTQTKKLKRINV